MGRLHLGGLTLPEHRVRSGDQFQLVTNSSLDITANASVRVRFDTGIMQDVGLQITSTGSGRLTQFTNSGFLSPGTVRGLSIVATRIAVKRGRVFTSLVTVQGGLQRDRLASGYIYDGYGLSLDTFQDPLEGRGFIQNLAIRDDVAPVDTTHAFGAVNLLRRIDGFIWYYHCSGDSATRTMRASVRDLGDGLPTGMTSGGNTLVKAYPSAGNLSLIADQEGLIYVNANTGKSFAVSVDTGVQTIEDITTDPDPFPYWATEDEVGELFFDVGSANANDRHSIYIIEEQWIQV